MDLACPRGMVESKGRRKSCTLKQRNSFSATFWLDSGIVNNTVGYPEYTVRISVFVVMGKIMTVEINGAWFCMHMFFCSMFICVTSVTCGMQTHTNRWARMRYKFLALCSRFSVQCNWTQLPTILAKGVFLSFSKWCDDCTSSLEWVSTTTLEDILRKTGGGYSIFNNSC